MIFHGNTTYNCSPKTGSPCQGLKNSSFLLSTKLKYNLKWHSSPTIVLLNTQNNIKMMVIQLIQLKLTQANTLYNCQSLAVVFLLSASFYCCWNDLNCASLNYLVSPTQHSLYICPFINPIISHPMSYANHSVQSFTSRVSNF